MHIPSACNEVTCIKKVCYLNVNESAAVKLIFNMHHINSKQ